jgi:hypothetical protein
MPPVTPPPNAPQLPVTHRVGIGRGGDGSRGSAAPPPEDLLPSGTAGHQAAANDLARVDIVFRLEVEVIRRQLAPVSSRSQLASSYGREATQRAIAGGPSIPDRGVTPLQVAYALRWLELATPDPASVSWADLLDGPLE